MTHSKVLLVRGRAMRPAEFARHLRDEWGISEGDARQRVAGYLRQWRAETLYWRKREIVYRLGEEG